MFLPLRAALIAGVLALVTSVLGLSPLATPATAAGDGIRLTVRLEVLNQPAWGDELRVNIETNQPDALGYVQLHRVNPDGSLLLLATPEEEGTFGVDSRLLGPTPGSHQLIATATRDNAGAESLKRVVTVGKRPTSVTFLDASVAPFGPVRVQVASGADHLIPTGDVVFVGPGILEQRRPVDAEGIARLDGLPPGTYPIQAYYLGADAYLSSDGAQQIRVRPFTITATGALSRSEVRAGDPVSLTVTMTGGHAAYPATGGWVLYWRVPNGDLDPVVSGDHDGSGQIVIDLPQWATQQVGTWPLFFAYDGNASNAGVWGAEMGTLTVGPARSATETTIALPGSGVLVGGTVTVQVTSPEGLPGGPVRLEREDGSLVTTGSAVDGTAVLTLPTSLPVGVHNLRASYAGSDDHRESVSALVPIVVVPAQVPGTPGTPGTPGSAASVDSTIVGKAVRKGRKVVLTFRVRADAPATGTVEIRDGRRLVRSVAVRKGRMKVVLGRLALGKHRLTATYLGSAAVAGSSRTWTVRVR